MLAICASVLLESFVYYSYYVISPVWFREFYSVLWHHSSYGLASKSSFLFPKVQMGPYVKHFLVSFTSQTVWGSFLSWKADTHFEEILLRAILGPRAPQRPGGLAVRAPCSLLGAALSGYVLSVPAVQRILHPYVVPSIPPMDAVWVRKFSGGFSQARAALQNLWLYEVLFTTIVGLAVAVRLQANKAGVAGMRDLKKIVTLTVNYVGKQEMGIRPIYGMSYAAMLAAYFRSLKLFLYLASAQLLAMYLVICVLSSQEFTRPREKAAAALPPEKDNAGEEGAAVAGATEAEEEEEETDEAEAKKTAPREKVSTKPQRRRRRKI